MNEKIVYVDMDDCLCDFRGAYLEQKQKYPEIEFPQSVPGLFKELKPLPDAIDCFLWLTSQEQLDVYILSAPSIKNPHCYSEKRLWVEDHLGFEHVNRLILSPHKNLSKGDYLIDDNISGKGQDLFEGELIHFGSKKFPDWLSVKSHFNHIIKDLGERTQGAPQHNDILGFRSFDMRDRFPQPVATFREALELLQSDRAYMPEWSGDIVCYLKDGRSITIPGSFYLEEVNAFESKEEATEWVIERAEYMKNGDKFRGSAAGCLITSSSLPIEQQIEEALNHTNTKLRDSQENNRVCLEVNDWLSGAIESLPRIALDKEK